MAATQWTPLQGLKSYGLILGRKMLFIALAWIIVYFISQPFRHEGDFNALMLFAPMIGSIAGFVAGWYVGTDAVEDAGFSGLTLWFLIVIGACLPMWLTEGLFHLLLRSWSFGFGGWMLLMFANLMAFASAIWIESSQE